MTTRATVRTWDDGEGWGVLGSPQTAGGCWAHFSSIAVAGRRALEVGAACWLDRERADQDGYAFRAVRAWPLGTEPVESVEQVVDENSTAYRSTLTLSFDDGSPNVVQHGAPD